jgi:TonB family protein
MLTPALLHAQANSAGQPLRASLEAPSALNAASKTDASVSLHKGGVSTGVVFPKLVSPLALAYDETHTLPVARDRTFVVSMTVDSNGTPQDVKIVNSTYGLMNRSVEEAVSHAHFVPGTVNNQPTEVPVTLEVVVRGVNR